MVQKGQRMRRMEKYNNEEVETKPRWSAIQSNKDLYTLEYEFETDMGCGKSVILSDFIEWLTEEVKE